VAILQAYDLTTAAVTLLPELNQPLLINWTKRISDIPQVSFSDVIDGKVPASAFQNKIVLVGVTASGIDNLATPFAKSTPKKCAYSC
jgi:CHASE2 domain-containing sensor protein